ncbi:MAG: hypothetical protein KIT27_08425 [Legionellales bacterium]|nr:hypothetical protein [Legionellales bacterium]
MMSQHLFKVFHNETPTYVLMGWDRPLQGFFMVIYKPLESDAPYYSNLDQEESHPNHIQPFLTVLKQHHIFVPQQMIDEIIEDANNNIGNKEVFHHIVAGVHRRSIGFNREDLFFLS